MPASEPWTPAETTRAIANIEKGIDKITNALDNRPDWQDINRLEAHRDGEQKKQDVRIDAAESRLDTLLFAVIGAALTGAAGLLLALVPG